MNFTIAVFSSLSVIFFIGIGMGIVQFRDRLKKRDQEEMLLLYEQEQL